MTPYPTSNNSWATRPTLPKSKSPSHPASEASDHPSPHTQQTSQSQADRYTQENFLPQIPQSQEVSHPDPQAKKQAENQLDSHIEPPSDLGQLISHQYESVDQIRSGFQFAAPVRRFKPRIPEPGTRQPKPPHNAGRQQQSDGAVPSPAAATANAGCFEENMPNPRDHNSVLSIPNSVGLPGRVFLPFYPRSDGQKYHVNGQVSTVMTPNSVQTDQSRLLLAKADSDIHGLSRNPERLAMFGEADPTQPPITASLSSNSHSHLDKLIAKNHLPRSQISRPVLPTQRASSPQDIPVNKFELKNASVQLEVDRPHLKQSTLDVPSSPSTLEEVDMIPTVEDDSRGHHHNKSDVHSQRRGGHDKGRAVKEIETQRPLPCQEEPRNDERMTGPQRRVPLSEERSGQKATSNDRIIVQRQDRLEARETREEKGGSDDYLGDLNFNSPGIPKQRGRGWRTSNPSRLEITNRPSARVTVQQPSLRPVSRDSNISKHRKPLSPDTAGPASPRLELEKKMKKQKKSLGNSWNGFFDYEEKYRQHLEAKIKKLQSVIQGHDSTVGRLKNELEAQKQVTEEMKVEMSQLHAHQDKDKEELMKNNAKVREMAKRCHEYRDSLNAAMAEQQRLYTKSKQRVKSIVDELKVENLASEKARLDSTSEILRDSEAKREAVQKSVNSAMIEARREAAELAKTIEVLKIQLSEGQRELEQEKEAAQMIRGDLNEARQLNKEALQSLAAQNVKVLEAIEERQDCGVEITQVFKEQDFKLDSLTQALGGLKSHLGDPQTIIDVLNCTRKDITKSILGEIERLDSKVSGIDQNELARDTKMDEVMNAFRIIDESLQHNASASGWQLKYEELEQKIHDYELTAKDNDQHGQKNVELQSEVAQLKEANAKFYDQERALKDKVVSLEKHVEELHSETQAIGALHTAESRRMEQLLSERDASIRDIQAKLKASAASCQEKSDGLIAVEAERAKIQQVLSTVEEVRSQTISDGIEVETRELREQHQTAEGRLAACDKARIELVRELEKAEDHIHRLSTGRTQEVTKLLKDDIRRISDLTTEFVAVKTGLEDLNPVSQWIESKNTLSAVEEKYKNLQTEFAHTYQSVLNGQEQVYLLFNQTQKTTAETQANTEPQVASDFHGIPVNHAELSSDQVARKRRVTVKSPVDEAVPKALSITQEREHRRRAHPAKPSIRAMHRSPKEVQAEDVTAPSTSAPVENIAAPEVPQRTQRKRKPELSIHSSYNRPVQSAKGKESGREGPPNKRRKTYDASPSDLGSNKTMKPLPASAVPNMDFSEEEVGETDMLKPTIGALQPGGREERSGPLKRNESVMITYGRQDSNESNQVSARTRRRSSSQRSSASTGTLRSND